MTKKWCSRIGLVLAVMASLSLAGCAGNSRMPRFYTLSDMTIQKRAGHTSGNDERLSVGLGPIEFPQYLTNPKIVTRTGRNELEMAEFDRWAEPLKQTFKNTLAENLAVLLGTEKIFVLPSQVIVPLDYTVNINVIQFDGRRGGHVDLKARWALLKGKTKEFKGVHKSFISEPTDGASYEALVAAHSRAVEKLSREIANGILKLSPQE